MACTVAFVEAAGQKELNIVPDVSTAKGISFGVSANCMLVPLNIKLNIVDFVRIFRVTSL